MIDNEHIIFADPASTEGAPVWRLNPLFLGADRTIPGPSLLNDNFSLSVDGLHFTTGEYPFKTYSTVNGALESSLVPPSGIISNTIIPSLFSPSMALKNQVVGVIEQVTVGLPIYAATSTSSTFLLVWNTDQPVGASNPQYFTMPDNTVSHGALCADGTCYTTLKPDGSTFGVFLQSPVTFSLPNQLNPEIRKTFCPFLRPGVGTTYDNVGKLLIGTKGADNHYPVFSNVTDDKSIWKGTTVASTISTPSFSQQWNGISTNGLICDLTLFHDESHLAFSNLGGQINIVDANTGSVGVQVAHSTFANDVQISTDGQWLVSRVGTEASTNTGVSYGSTNILRVWNTATGELRATVRLKIGRNFYFVPTTHQIAFRQQGSTSQEMGFLDLDKLPSQQDQLTPALERTISY